MKRLFTLFATVIFSASFTFAQEETITLVDGSIFTGYVSCQNFGKNTNFEITYSEFEKVLKVSDIIFEESKVVPEESLSLQWKKWADANNKYTGTGNSKMLKLVDMDIKGLGRRTCYVLERGTKYIKCHSVSEGTQSILATDIHHINKDVTNALLLNSLDEIVETDRQTYRGVIVEQYPGSRIKIYDKEDNSIHVLNFNEISSISKAASNADYSILDSSPYLEQVIIDGIVSPLGVIVKTGFDNGAKLLLHTEKGTKEYDYNSVSGILKQTNPNYRPAYDIILPKGEMRINRDSVIKFVKMDVAGQAKVGKGRNYDSDDKQFSLRADDSKEIFKLTEPNVTIEAPVSDSLGDVVYVFKPTCEKYSGKQKEPVTELTYTYEDVFNAEIHPKVTTSKNGTAKYEFTLPSFGYWFVLFKNKGVLCLNYSASEADIKTSTQIPPAKTVTEDVPKEAIAAKDNKSDINPSTPQTEMNMNVAKSSAHDKGCYGGINFDMGYVIVPPRKGNGYSLTYAMGYNHFFFHSLYASIQLGYCYSHNSVSVNVPGYNFSTVTDNHYIMLPFEMGYYIWFGNRNFSSDRGFIFALVPFIGGDPSFLVKSRVKQGSDTSDVDLKDVDISSISGKAGLKLSIGNLYVSGGYAFVKDSGNPFVSVGWVMVF